MKLEQKTVCSTWGTNLPRTSKQQRSAVTAIIKSLNRQMPVPGLVQDTGDTGLNLEPENKQAPGVRGMGRPRSLHQPAAQEPPGQPEQARQGEHTDGLPVRPASHPGAPPGPAPALAWRPTSRPQEEPLEPRSQEKFYPQSADEDSRGLLFCNETPPPLRTKARPGAGRAALHFSQDTHPLQPPKSCGPRTFLFKI
uniref:translation initiation factor IF-2-like isoform X12 n=1 Tax=Ictidomys tridecemlineatus TaxID=43179 RepID=UPI001A9EEDB7|nr:translation initiation factor IF-2-like isoform X12 [Ictidomys tridecemlineatus]